MTRSTGVEARHKVLLVDDDAVSLELMALLLAHEGHQVVRANDAGAALELLLSDKTGRPDVLLVDLQMPGVSGGQLAEKVRALGAPGPLLLAMSATEVQRQQLLAFDGFLLKPLAVDDLRKALKPKRRGRIPGVRVAHPGRAAAAPPPREPIDMASDRKAAHHDASGCAARHHCRLHRRYPVLCPCSPEPGTPRGRGRRAPPCPPN